MIKTPLSLFAFFALLLIGLVPTSSFATITLNVIAIDTLGGGYKTPSSAALPSGSLLRFGTLDIAAYNLLTSSQQDDFTTVNGLFTEMGTTTANAMGNFFSGNSAFVVPAGFNVGDQLYTWVFNASSAVSASAWGIFSSNITSWTVAADSGTTELRNSTLNQVVRGSSLGSGNYSLATITPTAIPEPGSGVLLAAGIAVLVLRRRRPRA